MIKTINIDFDNAPISHDNWECFCRDIKSELDAILLKYKRGKKNEIRHKINVIGKKDIVSTIDEEIEAELRNLCFKYFPLIPFIGEESYSNNLSVFENPIIFIIDPIDGTTQLAKGGDDWSISLGVVKLGNPYAAILYVPSRDRFYASIRGNGVFCNGKKIRSNKENNGLIAVSPHQVTFETYQGLIDNSQLVPVGIPSLTIKIDALLSGKVDAAVYFPQEGKCATVWDYVSVNLLIEELGGIMTSLDGNSLPYKGEGVVHKRGWLATINNKLYGRLLKVFNENI